MNILGIILAVPIIPTGLNGHYPEYSTGGIVGVLLIIASFLCLVIFHEKNKKTKN